MYTVELRSSKDSPFRPVRCHPEPTPDHDPWHLVSQALKDDIEAWDATFQASWKPERGWFAWDEIGVVYRRVGPRLRQRLREELDHQHFTVIMDNNDP